MHITVCLLVGEELSIRCACLEVTARFEFANAVKLSTLANLGSITGHFEMATNSSQGIDKGGFSFAIPGCLPSR